MRAAALLLMLVALGAPALAQPADARLTIMAFHDVVDAGAEGDAVTTDRFVGFLEWMRASGMHPVSLDDIDAANRGVRALPERAILLTFDDGYRSLYTRVYPLLLAYRVPAVSSLVGEWMDAPMDATVGYAGGPVPRRNFISWEEAREMQASGLVEFASHSYALHESVLANPHGGERPAAIALVYDPRTGYETAAQYRARVAFDLDRSRALMQRHLGRAPRALTWPYGRYRAAALDAAREAGFRFVFTLDAEPADPATPLALARFTPSGNPPIGDLVGALRTVGRTLPAQSMVCIDPSRLAGDDFEEKLGRAIERMRRLGVTAVAIDPFARDANDLPVAAWFPTEAMPVRADILSRIAWQMRTRAGVDVYLWLRGHGHDALSITQLSTFAGDLAAVAVIDGLLFENAPGFGEANADDSTAAIRQRRARDVGATPEAQTILAVFRAAEREWPSIKLALVQKAAMRPAAIADLTFVEVPLEASATPSPPAMDASPRLGPWITNVPGPPQADAVAAIVRASRSRGAMLAGWCPDDPLDDRPAAEVVAPEASAAYRVK